MKNRIYVGNLTHDTTEEDLVDNFSELGKCLSAKIIRDRDTGLSRGFAFVEMATEEDAQFAIKKCRGVELDGNKLIVKEAKEKADKGPQRTPGTGSGRRKKNSRARTQKG